MKKEIEDWLESHDGIILILKIDGKWKCLDGNKQLPRVDGKGTYSLIEKGCFVKIIPEIGSNEEICSTINEAIASAYKEQNEKALELYKKAKAKSSY